MIDFVSGEPFVWLISPNVLEYYSFLTEASGFPFKIFCLLCFLNEFAITFSFSSKWFQEAKQTQSVTDSLQIFTSGCELLFLDVSHLFYTTWSVCCQKVCCKNLFPQFQLKLQKSLSNSTHSDFALEEERMIFLCVTSKHFRHVDSFC